MNMDIYACAGFEKNASRDDSVLSSPGIPVSMARVGERGMIVSISGKEETKRFLAGLGFTPGTKVEAVCEANGSVILDVKGSKIAIDRRMASKILFCPER